MINTAFDFTTDTQGFWEGFWERRGGWGLGSADPDSDSPTLKLYHKKLWSKPLPNGQLMRLAEGVGQNDYLNWGVFRFGSDSITVSFNYEKFIHMKEALMKAVPDFRRYREDYVRRSYTIGGMLLFPKHRNSINQARGTRRRISDRWDLTLECIRRHYAGLESPLGDVLEADKAFFDLFVDFKGYVDFFFLQDCVYEDYQSVRFWEGDGTFRENPLPKTVDDYIRFIERELDFVEKRNRRIDMWQKSLHPAIKNV